VFAVSPLVLSLLQQVMDGGGEELVAGGLGLRQLGFQGVRVGAMIHQTVSDDFARNTRRNQALMDLETGYSVQELV